MRIARCPVTGHRYRVSLFRGKRKRKRVYTVLYKRWMDMKGRTKGRCTRSPHLYAGLELGWKSFAEFRRWALKNGFCKERSSPDRKDPDNGYVPGNVKFVALTTQYSSRRQWQHMDDYAVRGEDPPPEKHGPACPCGFCTDYWQAEASAA